MCVYVVDLVLDLSFLTPPYHSHTRTKTRNDDGHSFYEHYDGERGERERCYLVGVTRKRGASQTRRNGDMTFDCVALLGGERRA
jgi:hypothetical protein